MNLHEFTQNSNTTIQIPKPLFVRAKFWNILLSSSLFKGIAGKNKQNEDEIVTLRIHRGNKRTKPDSTDSSSAVNLDSIKTTQSSVNLNASASSSDRKTRTSSKRKEKIKISISYPSSDHIGSPTVSTTSSLHASFTSSCSKDPIAAFKGNHTCMEASGIKDEEQKLGGFSKSSSRKSKKHIKVQIRKFKLEAKAAKTLGLVVGMFIISWLPFFSVYLVRAFYKDCISDLLFSILFWLGYCNSAINPFIYAAFSSAFRFAFKSVIYRCFCSKKYCEENKFHVLHRFVPFPFAPPLAATASLRQDLDNGRWQSTLAPIVVSDLLVGSIVDSPSTAESTSTANLFRSRSLRAFNSISSV